MVARKRSASGAEEELSRRLRQSGPVELRRRRQPSPGLQVERDDTSISSDSDSESDDDNKSHSLRRRVARIFLQRFLKQRETTSEADFCLYFELHTESSDSNGDGDANVSGSNVTALKDWVRRRTVSSTVISEAHNATDDDNDDSSNSKSNRADHQRVPSAGEAHTVIEITAMLLRDAGCRVTLYPLQHADGELLAKTKSDARAYVMTVGFADAHLATPDAAASSPADSAVAKTPRRVLDHPRLLPAHHRKLPAYVTLHPAYTAHVLPLAGLAQTQQLTKLILTECRADHNLHLASGALVFAAHDNVLKQLARRTDVSVQLYPLHRDDFRKRMIHKWARHATHAPPLDDIYAYYGPKIAMYFAWLDFYTRMLVVPSACGLGLYIAAAAGHFSVQKSYCALSFLLAIGTSVFVDLWRRQQRVVEFAWQYEEAGLAQPGLSLGVDAHVETRSAFQGEWMEDPVSHERVYDFPRHKRLFRQLLAVPLLLSMCTVVGAYVVGLNMLSEHLHARYRSCFHQHHHDNGSVSPAACALIAHGPGVLNALIIYVMDVAYQQLAWRLNEFENYRTAREFEDNLVLKRMPFHFVNSNASLWFLAFYVQNLERVRERLWILLVGMQLLDNFKEVGLPFVVSLTGEFLTADGHRRRPSSRSSRRSSGWSDDVTTTDSNDLLRSLPELSRLHATLASAQARVARVLQQKRQAQYKDTFADYKEMMIQYGYVALYSPIFPLAPVFAYVNNVVESRSDFLKLVNTHSYQRPTAEHTRGIGVWEHVLVAFSVLAVLINFALVWTYELDDLLPSWSDLHRFMFLVVRVGCEGGCGGGVAVDTSK